MKGTVYNRGTASKPNWWVKVEQGTIVGEDGKVQRVRKQMRGGRTKKEAQETLTRLMAKLMDGSYVEPSKMTLEAYLSKEWLPRVREEVKPSTFASYKINAESHLIKRLGHLRLQALSTSHVRQLHADLRSSGRTDGKGGLSPVTVKHVHLLLTKVLGDALTDGYVARNVAKVVKPPKRDADADQSQDVAHEMKTWNGGELKAFLESVKEDRLYGAWHLSAHTGMRRGELLGLRWEDIDFERCQLAVRRALVQAGPSRKEIAFSEPKTVKGKRTVALDPMTVAVLREHRKAQLEERMAIGANYREMGLCFTDLDGGPLRPDSFSKRFDRHVRDSGLPKIRLHDLRHTHASLALQAGIHPKIVSERLGHSTVSFTLDVYSHCIKGMQEDAAVAFAALVEEA